MVCKEEGVFTPEVFQDYDDTVTVSEEIKRELGIIFSEDWCGVLQNKLTSG